MQTLYLPVFLRVLFSSTHHAQIWNHISQASPPVLIFLPWRFSPWSSCSLLTSHLHLQHEARAPLPHLVHTWASTSLSVFSPQPSSRFRPLSLVSQSPRTQDLCPKYILCVATLLKHFWSFVKYFFFWNISLSTLQTQAWALPLSSGTWTVATAPQSPQLPAWGSLNVPCTNSSCTLSPDQSSKSTAIPLSFGCSETLHGSPQFTK